MGILEMARGVVVDLARRTSSDEVVVASLMPIATMPFCSSVEESLENIL
jgi:hypothetical protein